MLFVIFCIVEVFGFLALLYLRDKGYPYLGAIVLGLSFGVAWSLGKRQGILEERNKFDFDNWNWRG